MARTYIAMASDVTDAVETTLSTMPLAVASSAKELRLILATTLQEFIWGGVHGQDDIRLVQAGQRHKGVHVGDAFLAQQLGVGTVAVDDQHTGEFFAHFLAASGVAVNNGHALLDVPAIP